LVIVPFIGKYMYIYTMKKAEAPNRFRLFQNQKTNINKYEKKEQGSQGGSTPVYIKR